VKLETNLKEHSPFRFLPFTVKDPSHQTPTKLSFSFSLNPFSQAILYYQKLSSEACIVTYRTLLFSDIAN